MDSFCEQVVKRRFGAKEKIIIGIVIAFFAFLELFVVSIYLTAPSPFWIIVTFSVAVIAVAAVLFVYSRIKDVEYDYSVAGNTLYIDKVTNKSRRKKCVRAEIGTIEDMGKIEGGNIPEGRYAVKKNLSAGNGEGDYYCIYREADKGRGLLIFTPNQKILDGMKHSLNRELVVKLFYKK